VSRCFLPQGRVSKTAVLLGSAIIAAYAWVASGFTTFSWPARAAALLPGLLVLGHAVRAGRPTGRRRMWTPGRLTRLALLGWALLVLAGTAWELLTLLAGTNRHLHPTLSSLWNAVLAVRAGRFGSYLAWLWLGAAVWRR
jgi:hypothetical protein